MVEKGEERRSERQEKRESENIEREPTREQERGKNIKRAKEKVTGIERKVKREGKERTGAANEGTTPTAPEKAIRPVKENVHWRDWKGEKARREQ